MPALGGWGGILTTQTWRSRELALAVTLVVLVSAIALAWIAIPARAATTYPKPLVIEKGTAAGENFGRSVAIADLNGDGVADFIVGAPQHSVGSRGQVGSVFVYLSGPDGHGGVAPFQSVVQLNGTSSGDNFGWSVSAVGDVNGDGIPDLAVGAPLAHVMLGGSLQSAVGNVTIIFGSSTFSAKSANRTLHGLAAGDEFGYSLAAAGDVNLDGVADFIVGAPYSSPGGLGGAGSAYVFEGVKSPGTLSNTPSFTFPGNSGGGHMGWSVAGGINVDKNTLVDMVAGAPDQGPNGAAYLIRNIAASPAPSISVVNGKNAGDKFGYSVAGLPDMNGNGFGDIAIGAPFNADGGASAGEVSVILGSSKFSTTVGLTLRGQPGEEFGFSVAAGDVHEDSFTDLLVGAPASSLNVTAGGRAYVFFGSTSPGTSANVTLVPQSSDGAAAFGSSLATGANFTAGHDFDFAVGAPQAKVSTVANVGDAYAYNGTKVIAPQQPTVVGFVCVPNTLLAGKCLGLAGFTVSLQNPGLTKTSLTPGSGAFNLSSVPAGTYFLNATDGGYIANTSVVSLAPNTNYVFRFFPQTIPLTMGVVKDAANTSFVNGVTVAMYNGTTLVNTTTSGPSGVYGMYLPVSLVPSMGKPTNVTLSAFDTTHYTVTTAKIALVRNETNSSDFNLNRFPFITGIVRDSSNLAPIRGASVQVTQGTATLATATTDNKGTYAVSATNASVPNIVFLNFTAVGHFRNTTMLAVDQNRAYSVSPFLAVDSVPPTSSLNALGTYTATAVFPVAGTDSDPNDNGVAQVQLWYKFANTGSFVLYGTVSNPGATFSFSFNSTAAQGDGNYQFYSLAEDYASNVQSVPSGNMTWTIVDTRPPVSSVNALPTFETVANFTVSATASDVNGIASVGLYYRKGTGGAYSLLSTDTTAPFSWFFNTTKLGTGDGLYQFYSIAADKAGNVETAPAAPDTHTTVDTVAPTLAITSPTSAQVVGVGWVNVTWTGSDATSGIAKFDARLDSNAWVHAGTKLYYNFTFVPDGDHTVKVNATDNAGNSQTVSVSFTVSTVTPAVSISAPADAAFLGSSSVQVTWSVTNTGAGLSAIQVQLDGGAAQSLAGSATTYMFSSLTDGTHTATVRAIGLNGAQGTATVSFTVDTTPPSVSITSPATNSWSASASVAISFTASDATSGIQSLMLAVDGGTAVDVTGQTSHTVTGLSEGSHTVAVTATDKAGNAQTASVTVKVDTVPPSVSITSPATNSWSASASLAVSFTATDATSGVSLVSLAVDGGTAVDVTGLTSHTVTGLSDGSHTVTVSVEDVAGNTASASITVKVDATPPSVSITSPATNTWSTSASVGVSFTASDAGSGISSVSLAVDGGSAVDVTSQTSYTLTSLSDGSHTVTLTAADVAGNTQAASVTVKVDTAPPTVSITAPSAGASLPAGNATVSWTASDGGSGLGSTQISVDGGAFQAVSGTSTVILNLAAGSHTVVVRATDVAGNHADATVTFSIAAPPSPGLDPLVVAGLGIGVVVVVVALAAYLYTRRRKGKGPEEPKEEGGET